MFESNTEQEPKAESKTRQTEEQTKHNTKQQAESNGNSEPETKKLEGFKVAMKDFIIDLIGTFPELNDGLHQGLVDLMEGKKTSGPIDELYDYCKTVYPPRFFDLLYQNKNIFEDGTMDTCFLPGIEFKNLWKLDISDKTREVIWKYLQLICFSLINDSDNLNSFGDTTKLFEAIGENELKEKLQETISNMSNLFDSSGNENIFGMDCSANLPNPDDLHDHISGLMEGKLGRLASQITEETLEEFQDLSGAKSVSDVFTKLFQDPGRLMKMVKKLGESLDSKIKSGEIKESELMEEAAEMMKNMKNMPGMENMQGLFEKMGMGGMAGMPGMGGKGKVNMNAMKGQLNQNIKTAKMKERMRAKLKKRQEEKAKTQGDQISILEKQLAEAKNTNSKLENIIGGNVKKNKKKKKRRKQKNKK